ncbi:uncharacterized protein LOC131253907 [Magnolia sinica]|uniref:uncharacterized protein LOC131253907 n=1 Tax=Magnolia sinica TaxID=86752 RepID=UPI00265B622A|nr:uncharacterized protein LOC131253907 [Magnolia sinica]
MDSQPEVLGAQVLGSTDSSNTKASSSSRKRGITRGVSLLVQPDRKKVLKMNEFGQPNEDCSNHRDFASHVGVLTRSHILIIYLDFRQVAHEQIHMVTKRLSQFYEFEGQSWDASLDYITKRINEAWRNYKRRLTAKYIKNKDPITMRDGPAPQVSLWRIGGSLWINVPPRNSRGQAQGIKLIGPS